MSSNIAVIVDNVSKSFKIPLESSNGVKQKLINFLKGRKGYRLFSPLNGITFNVEKGDFFGIVGRNGSGKSTLLKTIAGIYNTNGGTVAINGSLVPFIELGVGFNPELTGRENIFLNGALLGFSHSETEAMYDEIVDFAELHDFMEERIKNYSSGMQVRLAFSIAIQAKGDILLLDEVLAVGDSAFQKKCFDYFEDLKRNKKTIILVTHDMGAVKRFCNKAVFIENGKIVCQGDPSEVANYYLEANIQTVDINQLPSSRHRIEARIVDKNKNQIIIAFKYNIKDDASCYIGTSVIKDGVSVAEITTSLNKPLFGKGAMLYKLNTEHLNGGVYQFTASLFEIDDRGLLAVSNVKNVFTVDKEDITKGGALRLEDAWEYEQ